MPKQFLLYYSRSNQEFLIDSFPFFHNCLHFTIIWCDQVSFNHLSLFIRKEWNHSQFLYFFDEKIKKKRKSPMPFVPFHRKWKMTLLFFNWIRRDWRGSNPQLPPWQGGALTNWTTIPSLLGVFYYGIHILIMISFKLVYWVVKIDML